MFADKTPKSEKHNAPVAPLSVYIALCLALVADILKMVDQLQIQFGNMMVASMWRHAPQKVVQIVNKAQLYLLLVLQVHRPSR